MLKVVANSCGDAEQASATTRLYYSMLLSRAAMRGRAGMRCRRQGCNKVTRHDSAPRGGNGRRRMRCNSRQETSSSRQVQAEGGLQGMRVDGGVSMRRLMRNNTWAQSWRRRCETANALCCGCCGQYGGADADGGGEQQKLMAKCRRTRTRRAQCRCWKLGRASSASFRDAMC